MSSYFSSKHISCEVNADYKDIFYRFLGITTWSGE